MYLESASYKVLAAGTINIPRKFAGFLIVTEVETVLRSERFAPVCWNFSVGDFGSSLAKWHGAGEV